MPLIQQDTLKPNINFYSSFVQDFLINNHY